MQQNLAISVDRDFARFGNKSYAINKINSVEVRERHPHSQGAVFFWGLIGLIMGVVFLGSLSDPAAMGGAGASLVLCGFLAYWSWKQSQIVEFQLFLRTSSQEAQAFVSRDPELIARLRNRIERAIAGQLT